MQVVRVFGRFKRVDQTTNQVLEEGLYVVILENPVEPFVEIHARSLDELMGHVKTGQDSEIFRCSDIHDTVYNRDNISWGSKKSRCVIEPLDPSEAEHVHKLLNNL